MKVICQSRARSIAPSVETLYGAPLAGEEKVQTTNGRPAVKTVVVSNFGIPYGRGALDIARQVKAETGTPTDLAQLASEIAEMMVAWKTVTYPVAWTFMESCGDSVEDPRFLVNPWGRMRRFADTRDDRILSSMKRQAQNFPAV